MCNLSPSARSTLADALRENRALTGFSCFGNPDGYKADQNALKQAVIDTGAPLRVWNNGPLSSGIVAERTRKAFEYAIKHGGSAPWMRSKLMMVGEGRAGKSSTVRSLLGKPFKQEMEPTLGADTRSTVTVGKAVNWEENVEQDEFAQMAARGAAHRMRNMPTVPKPTLDPIRSATTLRSSQATAQLSRSEEESRESQPPNPMSTDSMSFTIPEEEIAMRFSEDLLLEALSEEDDPSKRKLTFSIWDYGGQEVFYALHHVFLTQFGVYCVVFDMTRLVGPSVTKESHEKCVDLLRFWLRSIQMHANGAPIFLVGTHKDEVPDVEQHREINRILLESLNIETVHRVGANHVEGSNVEAMWYFPIDNKLGAQRDQGIRFLREKIADSVREEEYITKAFPLTWIRTLDLLQKRQSKFMAWHEVVAMARGVGVHENHRDMLRLFHELGVLVYFDSSPELRQVVVLEPQWMLDAFTKVIRDIRYHPFDTKDVVLHTQYAKDLVELKKRGIVSRRLLFHLWSKEEPVCQTFLLSLMEKMWLLCDWVEVKEEQVEGDLFLVPSLFELDLGLNTMPKTQRKFEPELIFELNFERFFLPHGLYPRLVALVVSRSARFCDDSFIPRITKAKAIVSFQGALFIIEPVTKSNVIRVGVVEAKYFEMIRSVVVSKLGDINETVMDKALKMDLHLIVKGDDGESIAVDWKAVEKARAGGKQSVVTADGFSTIPMRQLDKYFTSNAESEVPNEVVPRQGERTPHQNDLTTGAFAQAGFHGNTNAIAHNTGTVNVNHYYGANPPRPDDKR